MKPTALPNMQRDFCGLEHSSPLSEYSWICSQPCQASVPSLLGNDQSPSPLLDLLSARPSWQLGQAPSLLSPDFTQSHWELHLDREHQH